jgi:transcriptional regulator of aromatic amino acid metabolism
LGGYATIAINNANIYSEIESEKNTLSAVVDLTDDPVVVLSPGNNLLIANTAARKALDLPDGNVIGENIDTMINGELVEFMSQEQTNGSVITGDVTLQNGRSYHAEMTLVVGGNRSILLQLK